MIRYGSHVASLPCSDFEEIRENLLQCKNWDNFPGPIHVKIGSVLLTCVFTMSARPVKFAMYCLTQWIPKFLGSFEIHWIRQYLVFSFISNKGSVNIQNEPTVKKSKLYVWPANIFSNFLYCYCMCSVLTRLVPLTIQKCVGRSFTCSVLLLIKMFRWHTLDSEPHATILDTLCKVTVIMYESYKYDKVSVLLIVGDIFADRYAGKSQNI